ncbi:hypothetical protein BHM03_00022412 [Ensete ventricosum]|nr:hypothetical protein BHM03_00022412 [Ensete ventricosum]
MSGDSELDLGGRLLEWWSPGEEGVLQFGSAADSCEKVGSGRLYVHWRPPYFRLASCLRRVGHVDGPAVRGYDNVTARQNTDPRVRIYRGICSLTSSNHKIHHLTDDISFWG